MKENDLTRKEIEERLSLHSVTICKALKQLIKYHEIMIKEYRPGKWHNIPIYSIKKEKGGKPPKK